MNRIIVGSGNQNKIKEIREILKDFDFEIIGKNDIGLKEDAEENGSSLEENSLIKAEFIRNKVSDTVIAEDSGLFVRALNWDPGVYSSRYSGVDATDSKNNKLLLSNLFGKKDRYAEFRTVVTLIDNDGIHAFKGFVKGKITDSEIGKNGFGYDPLFIPDGYEKTFGQLDDKIKNSISHRNMALQNMLLYFKGKNVNTCPF